MLGLVAQAKTASADKAKESESGAKAKAKAKANATAKRAEEEEQAVVELKRAEKAETSKKQEEQKAKTEAKAEAEAKNRTPSQIEEDERRDAAVKHEANAYLQTLFPELSKALVNMTLHRPANKCEYLSAYFQKMAHQKSASSDYLGEIQEKAVVAERVPHQNTMCVTFRLTDNHDVLHVLQALARMEEMNKNMVMGASTGSLSKHENAPVTFRPAHAFEVYSVVGIGYRLWNKWFEDAPEMIPKHFGEHYERRNTGKVKGKVPPIPSIPNDIFLHVRASRADLCHKFVTLMYAAIGPFNIDTTSVEDVFCNTMTEDNRDHSGFILGIKNRMKAEKRGMVALIGDEDASHKGGSFIYPSRWKHNLKQFNKLSIKDQEDMIGRVAKDGRNITHMGRRLPRDCHIVKTQASVDTKKFHHPSENSIYEVVRHSQPYYTLAEQGLYYITYGSSCHKFDAILDVMTGLARSHMDIAQEREEEKKRKEADDEDSGADDAEGDKEAEKKKRKKRAVKKFKRYDSLLDHVKPMTGYFYYMPSAQMLGRVVGEYEKIVEANAY